jgi:RNA polymerase sigma factor (TIGR02999 family)
MADDENEIETILTAVNDGDQDAAEQLWKLVYAELRALATHKLQGLPAGQTIQSTALVNEVYLRLCGQRGRGWESRAHFFGAAARAMRNILVDQARQRGRLKRGGANQRVPLSRIEVADETSDVELTWLDEVLERMERTDARAAEVVHLRYFGGLTIEQTAEVMGLSHATVEREWTYAKAWLRRELARPEEDGVQP